MPIRNAPFMNGEIYHVYNKTIDGIRLFQDSWISTRFINIARYYRSRNADLRYCFYNRLSEDLKMEKDKAIDDPNSYIVDVLQYCIMPNHYHLLLRTKSDGAIPVFMANVLNSITRYYNTLNKRKGPIFLTQFRSKHVASDEYLMEISRYIHLNPYNAGMTPSISSLIEYPYSSLADYITNRHTFGLSVEKNTILEQFGNSRSRYYRFLFDSLCTSGVHKEEGR